MGLLSQGSPMSWEETQRHADHVRRHGILQFLHIYHAVKDRHKDVLKWGDEVSARGPRPCSAPHLATQSRLCSARPDRRPPAPAAPASPASRVSGFPGVGPSSLRFQTCPFHSFSSVGASFSFIPYVRTRLREGVSLK